MAKTLIDEKIEQKRDNEDKNQDIAYDYNNFKAEYNQEVKEAQFKTETLNFTDPKEDESVEDAVEAVVEIKEPKNCTEEEMKGIGLYFENEYRI